MIQNIALFRYQLAGVLTARNLLIYAVLMAVAFLLSRFVFDLSIINSEVIAAAAFAEAVRIALVFYTVVVFCGQMHEDFVQQQFDRMLSMPVERYQYILVQSVLMAFCLLLMMIPVLILLVMLSDLSHALYWAAALYLELLLASLISMMMLLGLGKLTPAVILSLGLYVFARWAPGITQALENSSSVYDDSIAHQLYQQFFSLVNLVLPGADAFAGNDQFYQLSIDWGLLIVQLSNILVFGLLIIFVSLFDFYRKELRYNS